MIYLEEKYLNTVKEILNRFAENIDSVYAFGSRTRGNCKKYSDLDIAIEFKNNISENTILLIKDAFENSSLPINVDIVNLNLISEEFKNSISADLINMI